MAAQQTARLNQHHAANSLHNTGHVTFQGSGTGPINEGSGFHGNHPDGTRFQPMATHLDASDPYIDLEESIETDDLENDLGRGHMTSQGRGHMTSQGLFIPDEAEEPESLETPPDSDLDHEHITHQALRDLGLQQE